MTTNMALYYAIGSAIGSIQSFAELGIVAPFQDSFSPFGVEVDAQDGLVYGHGFSVTAMRWGVISQTERDLLKTYCPGKSGIVYIRVRDADWDWVYCKAAMIWLPENPPSNGSIVEFSIGFRIQENYGENLP